MGSGYCRECGNYMYGTHVCPPFWTVELPSQHHKTTVRAEDAETASCKFIDTMDDRGNNLGPFRVIVTSPDGVVTTWDVEGEATIDWRSDEVDNA